MDPQTQNNIPIIAASMISIFMFFITIIGYFFTHLFEQNRVLDPVAAAARIRLQQEFLIYCLAVNDLIKAWNGYFNEEYVLVVSGSIVLICLLNLYYFIR